MIKTRVLRVSPESEKILNLNNRVRNWVESISNRVEWRCGYSAHSLNYINWLEKKQTNYVNTVMLCVDAQLNGTDV